MNLLELPNEIQALCFGVLDKISDLTASRLVCKQLADICAPLLWRDGLIVALETRSLARLEFISQNPAFATSVRNLTFDLSYYDWEYTEFYNVYSFNVVRGLRAEFNSIKQSANTPQGEIFGHVAGELSAELEQARQEKDSRAKALMMAFLAKYDQLYDDQELAIEDFADTSRTASALRRLTNIRSIKIMDRPPNPFWIIKKDESPLYEALHDIIKRNFDRSESILQNEFPPAVMRDFRKGRPSYEKRVYDIITDTCLPKRQFKDEFPEDIIPSPMARVLVNIFEAMAISTSEPSSVELDITAPKYLKTALYMTKSELAYVKRAAKEARTVNVSVTSWTRPSGYTQKRSLRELKYMKRFIAALSSGHQKLEHLRINLHGYPDPRIITDISAGQCLLDLEWENLQSLDLCSVSFHETEFVEMIEGLPKSLKSLNLDEIRILGPRHGLFEGYI